MKNIRIIMVLALLLNTIQAFAQGNTDRIMIGGGLLYENGIDATLSWEHETKYHNAWEFFISGYLKWQDDPEVGHITKQSFWHYYNTWGIGTAYKPCVVRGRNHHGNVRIGAILGSDTHHFMGWIPVGYEHDYCLRYNIHLYWQVKTEMAIGRSKDFFRSGLEIGIKLPLN